MILVGNITLVIFHPLEEMDMYNGDLKFAKYAVAVVLVTLWGEAQAAGSFSAFYGQKSLNKNDWEPLESQAEFGFGVAYRRPDWPISMVGNYLSSEDSMAKPATYNNTYAATIKTTLSTEELGIGVRKYLGEESLKVFVEGGFASISAKVKVKGMVPALDISDDLGSESDSAIGFWFGAGVDVMVTEAVSIGALSRISNATVTFFRVDANTGLMLRQDYQAGGAHFVIYAAYHFQ